MMKAWLFFILIILGLATTASAESQRPNILLISIDTMRADHLGASGSEVDTPHMDELVADGVYFREARAQAPWTLPNFASIFTGLRPYRHGCVSKETKLADRMATLAEYLQILGYRTEAQVNADVLNKSFGLEQGFDQLTYTPPSWNAKYDPKGTERGVRRCFEVFKGQAPWFMHVHFFDVHTPYLSPGQYNRLYYEGNPNVGDEAVIPFLERTNDRLVREDIYRASPKQPFSPWLDGVHDLELPLAQYRGGVTWIDSQVGLILNRLKYLGLYEDCLIVLLSDHGETMGEQGFYFNHSQPYDAVLRVPLIMKFPGGRHGGRVVEDWVHTMDLLPTLSDYLDFELLTPVDGSSLLPLARRSRGYEREYFTAEEGDTPLDFIKSISDGRWHAIRYMHGGKITWELYDLRKDPAEAVNLAEEEPKKLRKLEKEMWKIFDEDFPVVESDRNPVAAPTEETDLSEEEKQRLRALGY